MFERVDRKIRPRNRRGRGVRELGGNAQSSGGSGRADLYEATRTRTNIVPVVGSVTGFGGAVFKTFAQISNSSSSPMSGSLIFHPAGQSSAASDPRISYALASFETRTFADLMASFGTTGFGSLEIVPATGAAPSSLVRVEDGGAVIIPQLHTEDVLASGSRAVLTTPSDLTRFRLNVGIRTFSSGVAMTVTLHDGAGAAIRSNSRTFPSNYLAQMSASDLVGGNIGPNQSVVIAVDSGNAAVYGSTVSNTGQGSTFQIVARVIQ